MVHQRDAAMKRPADYLGSLGKTYEPFGTLIAVHILRDAEVPGGIVLPERMMDATGGQLKASMDQDALMEASPAESERAMRDCLAALQPSHEVAQYTTSIAVRDLERVRVALGYDRINLYGVSYGSRVAQHYLRHHEAHVRSVILDGVVPPEGFPSCSHRLYISPVTGT